MLGVNERNGDSRTTPPSPRSTRERQRQRLPHESSTPQRRLFTGDAQQNNGCQIGRPPPTHNHIESRFVPPLESVPYHLETTHNESGRDFIGIQSSVVANASEGNQDQNMYVDDFELSGIDHMLEYTHQDSEGRGSPGMRPSRVPHNVGGTLQDYWRRDVSRVRASRMPSDVEDYRNTSFDYFDLYEVPIDFEGTNQDSDIRGFTGIEPSRVPIGAQYKNVVPNNLEGALHYTESRDIAGLEHCSVGNDIYSPQNKFMRFGDFDLAEVPYKERPFHFEDSFDGNFDTSTMKPNEISDQQWKVLEAISQGKSVFVTGSAGTGKSYLLKYAIKVLSELYGSSSVFVTASTGIAACHLGGRTLHSFAGVKFGEESAWGLAVIVMNSKEAWKRWKSAKALVIDEISMIDGEFFDKLEYVARKVRGSDKVFGGLQLIVTGDFFQLPPVKPPNRRKEFAFEADCWSMCFDMQIELKEVFRQADAEFVGMLEEIRKGSCSPRNILRLNSRMGVSNGTDEYGIIPTRLFPTKVDVRKYNDGELMALNKDAIPFTARDTGSEKSLLDCGVAPKELYLCEGAQVMLIWNLDVQMGLANGAKGIVVGFTCCEKRESRDISPKGLWPVVQFDGQKLVVRPVSWEVKENEKVIASRTQVPLVLAWALSVHKCQGLTLDRVETDLSKAFEYAMVYVALSRVKKLEGLRLTGFNPHKIIAHPKVFSFYAKFTEESN